MTSEFPAARPRQHARRHSAVIRVQESDREDRHSLPGRSGPSGGPLPLHRRIPPRASLHGYRIPIATPHAQHAPDVGGAGRGSGRRDVRSAPPTVCPRQESNLRHAVQEDAVNGGAKRFLAPWRFPRLRGLIGTRIRLDPGTSDMTISAGGAPGRNRTCAHGLGNRCSIH